ncbi:MAG TPA: hypothetical protein VFC78_06585 [Tepidisphaeraceae bacterium]|nr:hypothetical protein [Tepidisphaeraceae bacterium]
MQKATVRTLGARLISCLIAAALLLLAGGCPPSRPTGLANTRIPKADPGRLTVASADDPAGLGRGDGAVELNAASNEWTSFVLQVSVPSSEGYHIRLHALKSSNGAIPLGSFAAFQLVAMPMDTNRARFVRQTGTGVSGGGLPRALVAQEMSAGGMLNLRGLRDPARPADPRGREAGPGAQPALLWFDLDVPKGTAAGDYEGTVDLLAANRLAADQPAASVPIRLHVYDFALPDERHLEMVGELHWDRLQQLYPEQFANFPPSWVNRREGRFQATVRTLDHLVALAERNRVNLVVPAIAPIVKWPAGAEPTLDWRDFDSMVRPWLSGDAFGDHSRPHFWPLPKAQGLERFDHASQMQYWSAAVNHFTDETNPTGMAREDLGRVLASEPAIAGLPIVQPWLDGANGAADQFARDFRRDANSAGGDEAAARTPAWLAFVRHVKPPVYEHIFDTNFVFWGGILPSATGPDQPADPGERVWFYPGEWFGVNLPVPTVQLKRQRRAQQDYEYLLLAQDRGEVNAALQIARLITRPIDHDPGQTLDPADELMSGTANPRDWRKARQLLAQTILLRKPGEPVDPDRQRELNIRMLQWAGPRECPLLMARGATWTLAAPVPGQAGLGARIDLRLGVDIYNASRTKADQNRLRFSAAPAGWEAGHDEIAVPRLKPYRVFRAELSRQFNPGALTSDSPQPMEIQFVNGFTRNANAIRFTLPVAASYWRDSPPVIDGSLGDWSASDAIQDGPLVRMFNRPAVQRQELQLASTRSKIYTSWGAGDFHFAFALQGLAPDPHRARNFVEYEDRRAWGEDLCEALIQPIYADNNLGPVLHVICKPNGGVWVEQKAAPAPSTRDAAVWRNLGAAAVRYAATTPAGTWRGEAAIPWKAITGAGGQIPKLLRFNFAQHHAATGQSASWAGPVDFGRDEAFMGLLVLRKAGQAKGNGIVRTGK